MICMRESSFLQTILSVPESHRIMPHGSRTVPPVGNCTLPRRTIYARTYCTRMHMEMQGEIL